MTEIDIKDIPSIIEQSDNIIAYGISDFLKSQYMMREALKKTLNIINSNAITKVYIVLENLYSDNVDKEESRLVSVRIVGGWLDKENAIKQVNDMRDSCQCHNHSYYYEEVDINDKACL